MMKEVSITVRDGADTLWHSARHPAALIPPVV